MLDTLTLARQMHPGQRNSLDALCKRYHVDNTGRELHGALLDAQLLSDVYLAMTGGQGSCRWMPAVSSARPGPSRRSRLNATGLQLLVRQADEQELQAHREYLAMLEQSCPEGPVWRKMDA